jgi:hypothetical protein
MKTKKNLSADLAALGFPLLETEKNVDANATLAEVVRSRELRLWEGFPVLLMNSVEKGLFNYAETKKLLEPAERSTLDHLLLMSFVLYKTLDLKFSWASKLLLNLPFGPKEFRKRVRDFKNKGYFKSETVFLQANRLTTAFQNYFQENLLGPKDTLTPKEELGLEYALSQVFPPKQKELFLKKLHGEKLAKTEKEYYSRSVKKKVLALANDNLHQLAKNVALP